MYRVFISYSHEDQGLVSMIAKILEENGLQPMWDRQFALGHGFHEQIRTFIAHAHVFLPVITKTADERKWVHQEIGYAMSLNIPVLPVAAGRLPGEMIQMILAVRLGDDPNNPDLEVLRNHLSKPAIAGLVQRYSKSSLALFQCAQFPKDRAEMMAKYCNDIRDIGVHALVRQKGGLSSFHIPTQTITNRIWKERYGNTDRGPDHCHLQREERLSLQHHAQSEGCKLIINPHVQYDLMWGKGSRIVRLKCLLEFLDSMTSDKCQVAINAEMEQAESLTILGDWFVAESVSGRAKQGYRQTIFTRHAPSMLKRIEAFDAEFQEHLVAAGWKSDESRDKTIITIKSMIDDLEKNAQVSAT